MTRDDADHYLPIGGMHITHLPIWFEHCGYVTYLFTNVSQSHVICSIG